MQRLNSDANVFHARFEPLKAATKQNSFNKNSAGSIKEVSTLGSAPSTPGNKLFETFGKAIVDKLASKFLDLSLSENALGNFPQKSALL